MGTPLPARMYLTTEATIDRRTLLKGTGAGAAGQGVTLLVQLGYVALTARAFEPAAFGSVVVALSAAGVVSHLFGSGLAPAVMQSDLPEEGLLLASFARAARAGAYASALLLLMAWPWCAVWSAPEALPNCLLASIGTGVGPVAAVGMAHLRRKSRHIHASKVAAASSLGAMLGGALAVHLTMHPLALMTPFVLTPWMALLGCRLYGIRPRIRLRFGADNKEFGAYARSSTQLSVGSYLIDQAMFWGASRLLGLSTLGLLNRTLMLAEVPTAAVSLSLSTVAFAEYRRVPGDRILHFRNQAIVMHAMLLAAVVSLASVLSPIIVDVLLGGGPWIQVESLLPLALVCYWLSGVRATVGGILQQTGFFRALRWTQLIFAIGTAIQLIALAAFQSLPVLLVFAMLTQSVLLAYSLVEASRGGIIGLRRLIPALAGAAALVCASVLVTEAFLIAH